MARLLNFCLLVEVAVCFPTVNLLPSRQLKRDTVHVAKRQAVAFDPTAQYINTTGAHAWVAPDFGAGDQRGPCPGLNALANHNYLPHNGVATWEQIASTTNKIFGLGEDIASFLAFYGALFDGNILSTSPSYSIGGPAASVQNALGGTPQGLSGSHNKYESDASSGRYDLYSGGNDYKIDMSRFNALYALQANAPSPDYNLTVWSHHRKNMFLKSKHENPYFFYAPFAGVIASTGGFSFPPRLMSNKSAEHPDNGILGKDVLKTFFSISGPDNALVYTYGHERIPDNFYRRAIGNEYTAELFFEDFGMFAEYFPEMVSTGGNTGTVDSYTALDLGNLTGGIYNGQTLLQGNNLECFVFQSFLAAAPDLLKGGYDDMSSVLSALTDQISNFIGDQTCPQISKLDRSQFAQYPGYQQDPAL